MIRRRRRARECASGTTPIWCRGNFIVPGLIAVILMIIAANLSSLTIAREWENGTMEQLALDARPARRDGAGQTVGVFLLGIVDMVICLLVGVYLFDVPIKGSIAVAAGFELRVSVRRAGLGIMISATNRTQLMAYQMGTLTSFLPAFLLSGFIYSIGNMPRVIQAIALFVPARYFINISKGVFLKGIGLRDAVVRFSAAGGLRRRGVLFRDAQTAAEGGLSL